tara:strand:- start:33584 stop:33718 length:135 start_codon:yes stop_codon:yes gene_type:complete
MVLFAGPVPAEQANSEPQRLSDAETCRPEEKWQTGARQAVLPND